MPGQTGIQIPRIMHVPDFVSSAGTECVELARMTGLILDPWQELVLRKGLGEKQDGDWAAFEVSVIVSRQNGKGAIIEARELAGLFLFDEKLIIHTAHEVKTALESFARIVSLIDNCDDLRRRVKRVVRGKGSEAIELMNGNRLLFLSRTHSSGRGFTGDCLILDESMILGADAMAALIPTMSARKNPQVWYFGSAGIGDRSSQLAMLRARGIAGGDEDLAYFEWSIQGHDETCSYNCKEHWNADDQDGWLEANPAIGYRVSIPFLKKEYKALGPAKFLQERLGVGTYPDVTSGDCPISLQQWVALSNPHSVPSSDVAFAIDVPHTRDSASIALFSLRKDGIGHVEMVDRRFGTDWVVARLQELKGRWSPVAIAMDGKGPASSLLLDLAAVGIEESRDKDRPDRGDLMILNVQDLSAACGQLVDSVRQETIQHLGDESVISAIGGATQRPLQDAWVWARRKATVDISPLVAVTMARYAYMVRAELVTDYDVLDSVW